MQLATGWKYQTSSYNSATYGDCISASRVCFKISLTSDIMPMSNAAPDISNSPSYGLYIDSRNNDDLTCPSFPFTADVSVVCPISQNYAPVTSLPIAMILSKNIGLDSGIVLGPDYPAIESSSSGSCTTFGIRFGIPFLAKHGVWLCR